MEKFWSPWRSQYIDSFKDEKENNSCIFCKAAVNQNSDTKNLIVYRGEKCFVIMNLFPYNSGHLLIVPYRHLSNFNDLTTEEMSEMMKVVQCSIKALNLVMKPHGFNFGANLGKAAGAGIDDHLHFHLVPRWSGDTNFMPVLGDVKVISQDLLITRQNLENAFHEVLGENN